MNRQFHNKRQLLTVTDKHYYLTDQKKIAGHTSNIKLEEKSYKMSFKAKRHLYFTAVKKPTAEFVNLRGR